MKITDEQNIKCHAIIHGAAASTAAVGGGLAQIPLSDNAVIVPIQVAMIISLGAVLDMELTKTTATAILGTVATSTIGRGVSQVLFGWIPGVGNAINATTAAGVTEAAGWAAVAYFENLSDEEANKYKKAYNEGRKDEKAETEAKLKKINEDMSKVCAGIKEYENLENFIMGAFSIGIAAANIDDVISKEEREILELCIIGISFNMLPQNILSKVSTLFYNRPTFNDAMKIIQNVDKRYWKLFDDVVDAVLSIDNSDSEKKAAFKTAWKQKYNAA